MRTLERYCEATLVDRYFNRATMRAILFCIFYMLCCHWMACGWLLLARLQGPLSQPNWAYKDGLFEAAVTPFHWYCRAFYFVLTVIR